MAQTFLSPLLANPSGPHRLQHQDGRVIATELLPAFDSASRKTGLLNHQSLREGEAMVIAPCTAIHTFAMRFPIDVVFVAKNGAVLKTVEALAPWRISVAFGAFAVVELAAGSVARSGTRRGDLLIIT